MPRRSRSGASQRAVRVQKEQSASKKSQPLAWRPFPSVYSLAREIMASFLFPSVKSFLRRWSCDLLDCFLLFGTQQSDHLPAEFAYAFEGTYGHMQDLVE